MHLVRRSILAASLLATICTPALGEKQVVAGAGPSTRVAAAFFERLATTPAAQRGEFEVPERSAKHAGGIRASSRYLFGRTGRPLSQAERAWNKDEIILPRIPIVFACGPKAGVSRLTLAQLAQVFTGSIDRWQSLGGTSAPIVVVGREPTEALFTVLRQAHPFFGNARFDRVFRKDHQVVRFLQHPDGAYAIAFGALPNQTGLNVLEIEGLDVGVPVGLVYDLENADHPLVAQARDFATSDEWAAAVRQMGLIPPLFHASSQEQNL